MNIENLRNLLLNLWEIAQDNNYATALIVVGWYALGMYGYYMSSFNSTSHLHRMRLIDYYAFNQGFKKAFLFIVGGLIMSFLGPALLLIALRDHRRYLKDIEESV